ncbi:hypothetical protein Acsp04_54070 [Actinomadura sp. NBRC 104425]|uniref:DUF742 domain-containing protein n=1 Tax=Actinomadura sp. NBRC 104425 TaxID=3032204 RepID=UPI0024A017AA|nr:DUF742 domain-containing protein [Actinomadura sp. NBRC 104425]GLZ15164.1 hypothetical protein Acsp04_53990 [Actinomadura sp. NBRC 104425]GLZ15172.1 hypothetical protein Acsp04_54070 [Actinomadura sp. NBRC 104425]
MMPPEDDAMPPEATGEHTPDQQWSDGQWSDGQWSEDSTGPMVRPYVMTSGRLEPTRGHFDLITLVVAIGPLPDGEVGLTPEHLAILQLCQEVMSVAELTGHLNLPVATVRVLLGDLLDKGLITMQEPHPEADMHDIRLYKAVIDGLRAL